MLQQLWLLDQEQAVGLHFPEPDLGWILPLRSGAGDRPCLLGERSLSELLQAPHDSTDVDPEIGIRQLVATDYEAHTYGAVERPVAFTTINRVSLTSLGC